MRVTSFLALIALAAICPVFARSAEPPRRAKPPEWSPDVLDAFFEDTRQQLSGERPRKSSAGSAATDPGEIADEPTAAEDAAWSRLIDGETLAAEVKRIAASLRDPLANPAKFKAGGYRQCRADYSELAVLFGVIAEHDGDVRWKEDAPSLREALARSGQNCKTATDLTYAEAAALRTQLDDLIRGERLGGEPAELEKWSDLADRPLLMKRMEAALQEVISPALASSKEFTRRTADIRHEAEILAMLANLIEREEYDYWDDEPFQEQARKLRFAAQELTRAAVESNYDAARAAAGRAGQACSGCHDGYRG